MQIHLVDYIESTADALQQAMPMLLLCKCLSAIGVLDSVYGHRPSGEERLFKARALQEVRRHLASSETALADQVLWSLLWLTSYEVSRNISLFERVPHG